MATIRTNNHFDQTDIWVFDLDNTLYPPKHRLFDQIEERMRAFVSNFLKVSTREADRLRSEYWASHGTTLAGMMANHAMPPDDFLEDVHDIDFSVLPTDPVLAKLISDLPGRKIVFTNGTRPYANNVLAARGLDGIFEGVFGIEHANFTPKPQKQAFDRVFALADIDPTTMAMFEDDERNLEVPKALGSATVLVSPDAPESDYVDVHHHDLTSILQQIDATPSPSRRRRTMSAS